MTPHLFRDAPAYAWLESHPEDSHFIEARGHVCRVCGLRIGRSNDFDCHLNSLRITYKRKRNFIKLLD